MAGKRSLIFYLIITFLYSCSTIHHTIPPRPLAYHDYRGDFIISYDFNSTDILPDFGMNFYWGVGDDYNLGFGFNPPLGISHLTIAKYLESQRENVNYLYASLNGLPFSLNQHPNIELGGGVISKYNTDYHSFSAGLWFIFNNERILPTWTYPIFMLSKSDSMDFHLYPGIFLKYQLSTDAVRISLQNYMGLTSLDVKLRRLNTLDLGEKIVIPNSDIDSVKYDSSGYPPGYSIYTDYPYVYKLGEYLPYDYWFPDMDLFTINKYKLNEETRAYYLFKFDNPYYEGRHHLYEINGKKLMEDYENGKDIVLQYHPENTEKILHKIKWYLNDWSVGVAWKYK